MSDGGRHKSSASSSFHLLAGLTSGLTSALLLQPADLLKTRVQQSSSHSLVATLREIFSTPKPLRQLWRGTLPSCIRTSFGSALYFSSLNALRQQFARTATFTHNVTKQSSSSALPKLTAAGNLISGAVARASIGFIMMPVTVIKVRYESSFYSYPSLLVAVKDIAAKEGLRGLFAGFGATALRDAPYAGLYVLFYEGCKRRMEQTMQKTSELVANTNISHLQSGSASRDIASTANQARAEIGTSKAVSINFCSGALAASLATTVTNPPDTIKTRLQLMPQKYRNTLHAARTMLLEDGVRSFFDGLGMRIARKALSSALAWTVYEEAIRRVERHLQQ